MEIEVVEMERDVYVAAMKGDVKFLENGEDEYYYLKKTSEKNNIIHIAIRNEQRFFIEAALKKFSMSNCERLLCEGNSNQDTPLHIAAQVGNFIILKLLYDYLDKSSGVMGQFWREPNSKGNNPVHIAIIYDNLNIAKFLLNKHPCLARILNHNNEAPLHLAVKHFYSSQLGIESVAAENMSNMIKFLIEKESCVASWRDISGMTPLLRAASLKRPYNLNITELIIKHWPQAAEVCDDSGKTTLQLFIENTISYEDVKPLLLNREIYALRNHRDHHGNTPLLVAAKRHDPSMTRTLLDSSTKRNIINHDGDNAVEIINHFQPEIFQIQPQRSFAPEEWLAAKEADIRFLEDRLNKLGVDLLLSRQFSDNRKNLLHLLMELKNDVRVEYVEYLDFVKRILEFYPNLICQTDQSGNTPIHLLVRNCNTNIRIIDTTHDNEESSSLLWDSKLFSEILEICRHCILQLQQSPNTLGDHTIPSWLMQNKDGNTPLHEAILANNRTLMLKLLDYDHKAAEVVNNRKEKPLHLLARTSNETTFRREDIIGKMLKASVKAAQALDEEDLTPIMRAFKNDDVITAVIICDLSPNAAAIPDTNGDTFWHLLIKHPSSYYMGFLLKNKKLRERLEMRDKNGDTPLHSIMNSNRFDLLQTFLEIGDEDDDLGKQFGELLEIQNKSGITPADLIADSPNLPPQLEDKFGSNPRFRGLRSSWGIPRSQLNNYMNSMNIIAALQTTITFTAAFTVPGGLIEGVGFPILIRSIPFQIFMISDVIAMCLSMMVLLCLLWMVATDKYNSVLIQDFAVSLLLASFIATLLTFMTGVYATIFPVKPWIAIATLVLCTSLMLLINRYVVIKLLLPFKISTVKFFQVLWDLASRLLARIKQKMKKCYSYSS